MSGQNLELTGTGSTPPNRLEQVAGPVVLENGLVLRGAEVYVALRVGDGGRREMGRERERVVRPTYREELHQLDGTLGAGGVGSNHLAGLSRCGDRPYREHGQCV